MAKEIERKFLVDGDGWRQQGGGVLYSQGYLCMTPERVVRVRIAGETAWLTVKGAATGLTRSEFEYPIPLADARGILEEMAEKPLISKLRHTVRENGLVWEIDEFLGENGGLIIAEVELLDEEQVITPPSWLGAEVSDDPRYTNASLVRNPFTRWQGKK